MIATTLQRAIDSFFNAFHQANGAVVELAKEAKLHTKQGKDIVARATEYCIACDNLATRKIGLDPYRTDYTAEQIREGLHNYIAPLNDTEVLALCQSLYTDLSNANRSRITQDFNPQTAEQINGANLLLTVFTSCAFLPPKNRG